MVADTNAIIRKFLTSISELTNLVGNPARIYCPRLPENTTLPAVSFFTRGGRSNPYLSKIIDPSVQIDCWDDDPIGARSVYRALFTGLQGIQNQVVNLGTEAKPDNYTILSAEEEVSGQDLQDVDIPNYFRVLTFFRFKIQASI
jgi:hypothetical protein